VAGTYAGRRGFCWNLQRVRSERAHPALLDSFEGDWTLSGDYFAGVSLLIGAMLIVMHWNGVRSALSSFRRHMLAAAFAGIVLFLLVTAWFDLTFLPRPG